MVSSLNGALRLREAAFLVEGGIVYIACRLFIFERKSDDLDENEKVSMRAAALVRMRLSYNVDYRHLSIGLTNKDTVHLAFRPLNY